jgi:hypothetical protein
MSFSFEATQTIYRGQLFETCDMLGLDRPSYADEHYTIDYKLAKRIIDNVDTMIAMSDRFSMTQVRMIAVASAIQSIMVDYITTVTLAQPKSMNRNERTRYFRKATRKFKIELW